MIGLGTIVNALAIVGGGFIGLGCRRFLSERYQETMIRAMGFAIIVMSLGSTMSQMLTIDVTETEESFTWVFGTQGTMMMILSLAIGGLLGEWIDLETRFARFGAWMRNKTGNRGDKEFINAFLTATLTVCVGAMAIIGAIQDGLSGDHNTLFAKAVIDFVLITMMSASMGKGCMFSAVPVALWQGAVTLLSRFIAPLITGVALSHISYVGNVLILCVGVNLIWPKTIRVANLLPAILIAVFYP